MSASENLTSAYSKLIAKTGLGRFLPSAMFRHSAVQFHLVSVLDDDESMADGEADTCHKSANGKAHRTGAREANIYLSLPSLTILLASAFIAGCISVALYTAAFSTNSSGKWAAVERNSTASSSSSTISNFTVDPLLPRMRWPAFVSQTQPTAVPTGFPSSSSPAQSNESDVFQLYSPGRYATIRGAVISLFTPGQDDLAAYFEHKDRTFFGPMADHADVILFYTIYPRDARHELMTVLAKLNCTESTNATVLTAAELPLSGLYARLRHPSLAYPLELAAVQEFISLQGTHVITVPVAINMPTHLSTDPGKLFRSDWMRCANRVWNLDYELFSGAVFTHQLMFHPILRGYDYFIKVDLDVDFNKPLPTSIFHLMAAQQCVWMHTEYHAYNENCGLQADEAVTLFAFKHGTVPASFNQPWWPSLDYYYGNLIGGWLGWVRSNEQRQLAEFMFENEDIPGYFSHRWGDQGPFAKFIGMWFNLTDSEYKGRRPWENKEEHVTSAVCDFSHLRGNHFVHHD